MFIIIEIRILQQNDSAHESNFSWQLEVHAPLIAKFPCPRCEVTSKRPRKRLSVPDSP